MMNWIRRLGMLLGISFITATVNGQSDFAQWQQQRAAAFSDYSNELNAAYQAYAAAQITALQDFIAEVEALWGAGNVWLPESHAWVRYENQLTERTRVHFEDGMIELELINPSGAAVDSGEILASLEALLLTGTTDPLERHRAALIPSSNPEPRYVVAPGDTLWGISRKLQCSLHDLVSLNQLNPQNPIHPGQILRIPPAATGTADAVRSQPMLAGQVASPRDGELLGPHNSRSIAHAIIQQNPPQQIATANGTVTRIRFPMHPNHVEVRIQRVLPEAVRFAAEHNIPIPLVLAVMETESSFNPRARSYVPAFGLMQLVPASGARDAYRFVFSADRLVDADYLYDPANNIRLGTAYLYLLLNRYFARVQNPQSRLWCAIAAYNTGPGNVARTFTGRTDLRAAAERINQLPPDQVYHYMRQNLPFAETRNYIEKVRIAKERYESLASALP